MSDSQRPVTPPEPETEGDHWQLLRDVVAFQFKLAADGLRDLLLSPVSVIAALLGLFSNSKDPGLYFRRLMHFGKRTDRWINLFGAETHDGGGETSSDTYVRKVEDLIVGEYRKGGVVRSVKDRTDALIGRIKKEER